MSGLHPTPPTAAVLRAQLRAVGVALRPLWPVAAGAALIPAAVLVLDAMGGAPPQPLRIHQQLAPALAGLLLPFAVWRGEPRFGEGFLWTLPVSHARHALAKVAAGWAWLMAGVALLVAALVAAALWTGGGILAEETLHVVSGEGVRAVRWRPDAFLLLAPFTSATIAYLLASAATLGVRRPRSVAVAAAVVVLAAGAADVVGRAIRSEALVFAPSRAWSGLLYGDLGLARMMTAGTDVVPWKMVDGAGAVVPAWPGVPDAGAWGLATLLWTGISLALLTVAARRHRESG